ncbi:MAG: ferredoxin [SAR324 cluster bacterium]|uniref:Ferredoxin n=1 Tax=SAR324 cluster bacterium TaxID=2024889 RepID=A0A2A4SWN5_9DELT|nr:MAG: ferredoxin [SAR324 cluster bacterium]
MATTKGKLPENIPGQFYVDEECIDCNLCEEIAPNNFLGNPEEGYHYVIKQPSTKEEEELVRDALDSCPTEAIGDDGEN